MRAFSDGDSVFAHTEYDFASRPIGVEVSGSMATARSSTWDTIQPRRGPNPVGSQRGRRRDGGDFEEWRNDNGRF